MARWAEAFNPLDGVRLGTGGPSLDCLTFGKVISQSNAARQTNRYLGLCAFIRG